MHDVNSMYYHMIELLDVIRQLEGLVDDQQVQINRLTAQIEADTDTMRSAFTLLKDQQAYIEELEADASKNAETLRLALYL